MFKIVNSILFYYYFNVLALLVYPYIAIRSLITNNNNDLTFRTIEYSILVLPLLMIFSILCIKYNFMFSGYLLMFYFGGYFFFIYFRQNNIEIGLKNVLILLCVLTLLESLAINTIILPSDLPNWPLSVEDTILHGNTSRGGIQFANFYYIRPIGFGGNSSITASLIMTILIYLNNVKEDSFFVNLISFLTVVILFSGAGYMFLGIYILFLSRIFILSIFLITAMLIYGEISNIQKLDLDYYQFIIIDIAQNVLWVIGSINLAELVFGQVIPFESPIGGDFYWLYFFQWFGLIGISFYFLLILVNVNRINYLPIMILVISTLHYHTIFSIPGQMLFGYLLTRSYSTYDNNQYN